MLNNFRKVADKILALSPVMLLCITVAAALLSGVVFFAALPAITGGSQIYTDVIVGEITFADAYKHGDLLLAYLGVGGFFIFWLLLAVLAGLGTKGALAQTEPVKPGNFSRLPAVGFICAAIALLLLRKNDAWFEVSSLLLLAVLYLVALQFSGRDDSRTALACLTSLAVSIWGIFFSAIGLLALGRFFLPQLLAGKEELLRVIPLYASLAGALLLAGFIRVPGRFPIRVALACQVLVPLVLLPFFTLVMPFNGVAAHNLLPLSARLLGLLVVCGGVALNLKCLLRPDQSPDNRPMVLVSAVVSAAAYLAYIPPQVKQVDFFHTGELLLAWQQVFEKGQFPYTGFAWARGWSDAIPGFINSLLLGGTFATFDVAFNLMGMTITGLAAYLLCRTVGPVWGLVLSTLGAQLVTFKWFIFLPVLLILVDRELLKKPLRWLAVWSVISIIHCLFQATTGLALTIGTMPIALWILVAAWSRGDFATAWQTQRNSMVAALAGLLCFFGAVTPLLLGFVTYVREQGVVNEIANGTILLRAMRIPAWFRWQNQIIWELFRVGGWLVAIVLFWHWLCRERLGKTCPDRSTLPAPATVVGFAGICSTIVFIPYSLGRIDSAGLSRTGTVALFALGILLPLMLVLSGRMKTRAGAILCGLLLGVALVPFRINPAELAGRSIEPVKVPADAVWLDGAAIGLPKIGALYLPAEQANMIVNLKRTFDRVVRPEETYFDLTNHLALYYYLDKKVSSVYAGFYIVTSEELQNKVIATLEKSPPPLVLTGPARPFGSGVASLRCYRVYRWLMQNGYRPYIENGLGYLVRPDRYPVVQPAAVTPTVATDQLLSMFGHETLAAIPLAWGRNLARLAPRFDRVSVQQPEITTRVETRYVADGTAILPVTRILCRLGEGVDGNVADFLVLRFKAERQPEHAVVWLRWQSADQTMHELRFEAEPGIPLLIPAGSHPGWLGGGRISQLALDISGSPAVIEQLDFLHLKK